MARKEKSSLAKWLIQKNMKTAYIIGNDTRIRHIKINQEMIDEIGFYELKKQAFELENLGLLEVDWSAVKTDLKEIHFKLEDIPSLCEREGMEDLHEVWLRCCKDVEKRRSRVKEETWLHQYYSQLMGQLEKGAGIAEARQTELLDCLDAIAGLAEDVWKRKFSSDVLGDSKKFERVLQSRVTGVLKKYSSYAGYVDEGDVAKKDKKRIEQDLILSEFHILTYSQTLEVKGHLEYEIFDDGGEIHHVSTREQRYGAILNAQTLMHSVPVSLPGVRRIITIENKANYEDMKYEEDCLYIYVHGFPSFKERNFIKMMLQGQKEAVPVYHWGDMDYGGIRIYNYLKKELFPNLQPMKMGTTDFEKAISEGKGIPISKSKREKLEGMDAGDLDNLKRLILESGFEVEQENV